MKNRLTERMPLASVQVLLHVFCVPRPQWKELVRGDEKLHRRLPSQIWEEENRRIRCEMTELALPILDVFRAET